MRKHMLGTVTALMAIVLMAGAQTPSGERAALEKVAVVSGSTGLNIELTTRGAVTPKVETLTSPDRLVVDLPNTALATSSTRVRVGREGVTGVRMGTDASAMTRVVVDLERPCGYDLVSGTGNGLVLKLHTATQTAKVAPAPAKVNSPVVAAAAPVVAKADETKKPAAQD